MTEHPTWKDILDEPFLALILGRRGSGKSSLGHRLLEVFGRNNPDRDAYIMGFPESQMGLLPEWINHLPIDTPLKHWPDDAIVFITEVHLFMHARRSMSDENLDLDTMVALSRQKNIDLPMDTQYARRLDVSGVMGANATIWRYPSLLQEYFERQALRKFVREAKESLDEYVDEQDNGDYVYREDTPELKKHAYIFSEKFRGMYPHEIQEADHYSDEVSTAVANYLEESGVASDVAEKDPQNYNAWGGS